MKYTRLVAGLFVTVFAISFAGSFATGEPPRPPTTRPGANPVPPTQQPQTPPPPQTQPSQPATQQQPQPQQPMLQQQPQQDQLFLQQLQFQQWLQEQQLLQQQQVDQQRAQQLRQLLAAESARFDAAVRDAAKARTELKKAQLALASATQKFEKSIESKPDVKAASEELKKAQETLQSASASVAKTLVARADYQRTVGEAREARDKVESLRGNPAASPDERLAAAQAALTANKAATAIETAAYDSDGRVKQARTAVAVANDSLRKARDSYANALHDDPSWQAASAEVDQRQKDVAAADVKLADVKKSIAQRLAAGI